MADAQRYGKNEWSAKTPDVRARGKQVADQAVRQSNDVDLLWTAAVAVGVAWAVLFVVVGLSCDLHYYGDGSLFSYAVAVEDAWRFHWHNISGRLLVYLFAHWPAEVFIALTGDARGGIAIYGLLFHSAPLVGLIATWYADRSAGRSLFAWACLSTAVLCPFVFGFPTEMWFAHALFWPTLAVACQPRTGWGGIALGLGFVALVLTHGGGVVLALSIVVGLFLSDRRDGQFSQVVLAFAAAITILLVVLVVIRPDPYIGKVIANAAFSFIDPRNLLAPAVLLLATAITACALIGFVAMRCGSTQPYSVAFASTGLGLLAYWLTLDTALLADERYPLRTLLLAGTPIAGWLAAITARAGPQQYTSPFSAGALTALTRRVPPQALVAVLAVTILVHGVETAKFVFAWRGYKNAVRELAVGQQSDPSLGHPQFVSSTRIDDANSRLGWSSTTHFLSILLAPGFKPSRLVVSPSPAYWWLSCATATASANAARSVPVDSRLLVRGYACGH